MFEYIKIFCLILYVVSSIGLMAYGLHCYVMIFLFLKGHKKIRAENNKKFEKFISTISYDDYPFVTIQLPVYNEAEVVERLIRSASLMDYPIDKFEIQILDDSNDETSEIIDRVIKNLKFTIANINVIRRDGREGFKAGALALGLKSAKGEYITIFDSDFILPENFLKRGISVLYRDPEIACLQGRWGHVNRLENWLTRAQSVGIDGHFTAEQGAPRPEVTADYA